MAKVRAYYDPDPSAIWTLYVAHWFWDDPYEPGAYHLIYPYGYLQVPPGYSCGQYVTSLEEGLIAAHTWASRPAMLNDICIECRYFHFGANTPRWNIYRGEEHPKYYPDFAEYPARLVPGFVWDFWDSFEGRHPPGYGQRP